SRGSGTSIGRATARLRCIDHAGGDGRAFGTVGRRSPDAGHPACHAACGHRPRPLLPVSRLRSAAHLVRRPPRDPLGARRSNGVAEPAALVPAPPPDGARAGWLPARSARRRAGLSAAGRVRAGRSGATTTRPLTRRLTLHRPSRTIQALLAAPSRLAPGRTRAKADEGGDGMNSTDRWLRTGAALAVVGGIVALVAVYIPAFVIKGPGVDTTEKLFRDWEGKVGLVSGAIMVLGGLALWVTDERTQRKLIAALVGLASLVAIGSAAYAVSVFRSKALHSLAEAFAAQQR